MKQVYHTYLNIIKKNCTDSECKIVVPKEEYSELMELAKKQCTLPFLLPYFRDTPYFLFLKQQTKQILLNYYELEHFTRKTVSLLSQNQISCYLLKGLSLAAYYPVPEYRKLGDVDLYINDSETFEKAKSLLISTAPLNIKPPLFFAFKSVYNSIFYKKRQIGCNCDKVMIQSFEWSVKNINLRVRKFYGNINLCKTYQSKNDSEVHSANRSYDDFYVTLHGC